MVVDRKKYSALKKIVLLIVEDDPNTLEELKDIFERYCYKCYASSDPLEALEIFKQYSPDVIISDYEMPHLNGLEFAQEIKKINQMTPIIINSIFADINIFLQAIETGISGYLLKPTNAHRLLEAVYKVSLNIIKEKELKYHNNLLEILLNEIKDPFLVIDLDYNILYINECARKNSPTTDALQSKCYNLLYGYDSPCHNHDNKECPLTNIKNDGFTQKITHEHTSKSGQKSYFEISPTPLKDENGEIYAFVETIHDVTEYKNETNQLRHSASHDALTDLPNRVLLSDRIEQAQARVDRNGGLFALLFIDLDHFKKINDEHGHAVGDMILKNVAKRIRKIIRKSDTLARIGGDEFVLLIEAQNIHSDIEIVAGDILRVTQEPFVIFDLILHVGCSIGIETYTKGCDKTKEQLIHNADKAMYKAKKEGRAGFRFA